MLLALPDPAKAGDAGLTIDSCMAMAERNYPQIRQLDLIDMAEKYDISNARLEWVPKLTVSGKASYQSDVTQMPFTMPGFDFTMPKDQYSVYAEISQTLWDGGSSGSRVRTARAGADVQRQQTMVSVYSVREQVQNIYLGILLIDRQLKQNGLLMESLERSRNEVRALMESGMAYASDMKIVEVNILDCRQKTSQLNSDRAAYLEMLGKLTGCDMTGAVLSEPDCEIDLDSLVVKRPELELYDARLRQNDAQRKELDTRISPKFNVFFQGGAGQPGLNMLEKGFKPYWMAGVKMQWDIGSLYTRSNDLKKIENERESVELERETFLFNTGLSVTDQTNAVRKAMDLLEQDRDIIALRESIRISGEEQYRCGVIKMTDLMDLIDDEHDARIAESVHRIQLLMEIYKLRNSIGQ